MSLTKNQLIPILESNGYNLYPYCRWSEWKGCKFVSKKNRSADLLLKLESRPDGGFGDAIILLDNDIYECRVISKWSDDDSRVETWSGPYGPTSNPSKENILMHTYGTQPLYLQDYLHN